MVTPWYFFMSSLWDHEVSWSRGQIFYFPPPYCEIFSRSHGEISITNNIFYNKKLFLTMNIVIRQNFMVSLWDHELSHGLMTSWWDDEIYQGPFFYFHPPHSEIFSLCHGEITIKNLFFHEKLSLTMSITSKQKSISLMVSRWDHEISHGLMINFYFHPPHHEIFSWSHGEITMINYILHNEKFILNIIIATRPKSLSLMVSQWDREISYFSWCHDLPVKKWGLMVSG